MLLSISCLNSGECHPFWLTWVNRERLCGASVKTSGLFCCLLFWLREFCRTVEIMARTLHEVVTRVRLCGHHNHRSSNGEVHVYGERESESGCRFDLVILLH